MVLAHPCNVHSVVFMLKECYFCMVIDPHGPSRHHSDGQVTRLKSPPAAQQRRRKKLSRSKSDVVPGEERTNRKPREIDKGGTNQGAGHITSDESDDSEEDGVCSHIVSIYFVKIFFCNLRGRKYQEQVH